MSFILSKYIPIVEAVPKTDLEQVHDKLQQFFTSHVKITSTGLEIKKEQHIPEMNHSSIKTIALTSMIDGIIRDNRGKNVQKEAEMDLYKETIVVYSTEFDWSCISIFWTNFIITRGTVKMKNETSAQIAFVDEATVTTAKLNDIITSYPFTIVRFIDRARLFISPQHTVIPLLGKYHVIVQLKRG